MDILRFVRRTERTGAGLLQAPVRYTESVPAYSSRYQGATLNRGVLRLLYSAGSPAYGQTRQKLAKISLSHGKTLDIPTLMTYNNKHETASKGTEFERR